jgi:NADH:ubiquinone reductase (H+-translocating)
LTFVIVGGGATGVELAGAIAEIVRQALKDDFRSIHPEEAQIILLDGAPRVLGPFPETLSAKAERSLKRLGVHLRTGARVNRIDLDGITLESGGSEEWLPTRTVIWAGGVTAAPLGRILAERTRAETDRGGRIEVGPDLTIAGYPEIYVVGDLALYRDREGKPLPGVAQVAMQQGAYAAKAIPKRFVGKAVGRPSNTSIKAAWQ